MASNRIGYDDIFDPKALDKAIEEVKRLQEELKGASNELKEMVKTSSDLAKVTNNTFKNADNIREVEKAINDTTKATEQLDAVQKKRIKLEEQLAQLDDERAKSNALLAEQLKARRKELRDEAKATLQAGNAYKELTKRTNEAQAEFKRLAAQFGVNSKEAREAGKRFDKLDKQLRQVNDAARDGRRDVGRYRIAVGKLNDTLAKMGAAAGVVAVLSKLFEGFQNVLGNNSQAAAAVEKGLSAISIIFTVVLSRVVKAVNALQNLANIFEVVALKGANMMHELSSSFDFFSSSSEDVSDKIAKNEERIKELEATTKDFDETTGDLTDTFAGLSDEISKTIEKNNKLIDTTLRYRRQSLALQKQIDSQLHAQAQLQAAADNENNSLVERMGYQDALIAQTELINSLILEQATLQEDLAVKNANIFIDSQDAQDAAQEAISNRIALEIAQEEDLLAKKTELQTLDRDLLEQRLDFLIDDFDNQKTINERIIADDTKTFEERQRLVEENQKLAAENFAAQIDLFNERAEKQGKAQLDLEALSMESDSRVIAEQAKNAGISEALLVRVLEVIRERRTVNQDLIETEKELNEIQTEANKTQRETALDLATVNELKEKGVDVEEVLARLEDERLKMQIENLRFQISLLDKNSEKRIALEKELSEALLDEQTRRLDKEKAAAEKAAEKRVEIQEAAAATIERLAEKSFEKRIDKIDSLIDAEKTRQDELRELAQKGIQDADNNLAESQKRAAELEKQREKELQRQRNFELGLAAARAYSANVAADVPNPLAKTITDVALLEAFIDSLVGFYHGTEDTGNSGLLADEFGVITGYTHANERVMTAQQNSLLPDSVSNWELVSLANLGAQAVSTPNTADLMLANGLKEVKSAIERKPSYLGRDYDSTERAIIDTYHEKGRKLRKHYKRGGLISRKRA